MTKQELFDEFVAGFQARKFSAGLLVAFIDFLTELGAPDATLESFDDFLALHPRQEETAQGKRANTLIVAHGESTLSIRPFYNQVERFFRAENKRFDYPSCAPHATQAWRDYRPWLDALVTFDHESLQTLRTGVVEYVLETLESQEFDPSSVRVDPPVFARILEDFDVTSQKGEPTGAAYQGIVFGFLRADNPHLQIEISKVRTGSKRLQRVGDVDGWEGGRLAVSAEVKQYVLGPDAIPDLEAFANEAGRRGAVGLVVALGFEPEAREGLEGLGLKPLDKDDLLAIVELWDPMKQRIAAMSFVYYAEHVELNSSLTRRLREFMEAVRDEGSEG